MATYAEIYTNVQDGAITAQIAIAMTEEAKYALGQADVDTKTWATYIIPNSMNEAKRWQMVICIDPAIADAVEVRDEDVKAAVTALVPTMVSAYKASLPVGG